jgi:hypothetical protein
MGPYGRHREAPPKPLLPHPITQIVSQTTSFHLLFVKEGLIQYQTSNTLRPTCSFGDMLITINVAQIIMVMHFYP